MGDPTNLSATLMSRVDAVQMARVDLVLEHAVEAFWDVVETKYPAQMGSYESQHGDLLNAIMAGWLEHSRAIIAALLIEAPIQNDC